MPNTHEDLARVMFAIARNIDPHSSRTLCRMALAGDQTLVLATPVDTGRARSNWIVTIGAPAESPINPYVPYPKRSGKDFRERANAAAAIEQGQSAIRAHIPGMKIFITNNVNYVPILNTGTSRQAGPQFIEKAIQASIREFERRGAVINVRT